MRGWRFSSVVERSPSKSKALGLILSSKKRKRKKKQVLSLVGLELTNHLDRWASEPFGSSCLRLFVLELQTTPNFLLESWRAKLGSSHLHSKHFTETRSQP